MMYRSITILLLLLAACSHPAARRETLGDVDFVGKRQARAGTPAAASNAEDIRRAYLEYLKHAAKTDKSRADALQRLAQLEFQVNESRSKGSTDQNADAEKDNAYYASIDRNIDLLQTLLRDHPKSENADRTLYQLARAYDQRAMHDKSMEALERLVKQYPKSPHYAESQFRIAERAFITGQYARAEDLYTDVLVTKNNGLFREKARYKRGWARFKQNFYREAIDDFAAVINMNDFDNMAKATSAVKNNYEEYFRALGLSFVYLGGPSTLQEYFKEQPRFKYIHQTYFRVSELYMDDQRYSDAATTLDQFAKNYPQSPMLPEAALKKVNIWIASGFQGSFNRSLEELYTNYNPQASYWSGPNISLETRANVTAALRTQLLTASARAHKDYQANKNASNFQAARQWYERYLKHYQAYSRKENVHFLFGELLAQNGNIAEALSHYERAAFDGDIIVNPDAAFAAISTTARVHQSTTDVQLKKDYLVKLVRYSLLYIRLYPADKQSIPIMTRAAEEAYRDGLYQQAVELVDQIGSIPYQTDSYNLHSLKAHSNFKLGRYADAEAGYLALLKHYKPDNRTRTQIQDNLAISIYNQATAAKNRNAVTEALQHYARMSNTVPDSEISATGLYEGISLAFDNKLWPDVVAQIQRFQKLYPSHKLSLDVSKKLSVAYLNTNQEEAAASVLIKVSRSDENADYKIAALWKAAELLESRKDVPGAIKAFEEYAANYPRPFPNHLESMHKLAGLYSQTRDENRANHWRNRILETEKRAAESDKNDRTNLISAQAALYLARQAGRQFEAIRLTLPLNRSLEQKKSALQKALNFYGRAASYGIPETATEATSGIADVYYAFSRALLESERPRNLGKAELEQYKILLEDQAFPFEDNAIKFYEKNLSYTKQGVANEWTRRSRDQLRKLFPSRYGRDPMLEAYIGVLH